MKRVVLRDPAIRNYLCGKGYRDLGAAFERCLDQNWQLAEDYTRTARRGTSFSIAFHYATGASVVFFGAILCFIATFLHLVLLLLGHLVYLSVVCVLGLVDRIYRKLRNWRVICPHCHVTNSTPDYLCDNCGRVHRYLWPNTYGVFRHQCKCGQMLPSTFLLNRGRLATRCPERDCQVALERGHTEASRIFVPIVAGPSAGKTSFVFGVVHRLVEEFAPQMGYHAEPLDVRSKNAYREMSKQLERGEILGKTTDPHPPAFNLAFYKGAKLRFVLYLYDPAGEAFLGLEKLRQHRFHSYMNGMILLIDPFAVPVVRELYREKINLKKEGLKPSEAPLLGTLEYVLMHLESEFDLPKEGQVKVPMAVVVNKVDAFDLENVIGEAAVSRIRKDQGDDGARNRLGGQQLDSREPTAAAAVTLRDRIIRNQFQDWDETSVVNRLDRRFRRVRYFTCSALGRMPSDSVQPFKSKRAHWPVFWILLNSSGVPRDFRKQLAQRLSKEADFAISSADEEPSGILIRPRRLSWATWVVGTLTAVSLLISGLLFLYSPSLYPRVWTWRFQRTVAQGDFLAAQQLVRSGTAEFFENSGLEQTLETWLRTERFHDAAVLALGETGGLDEVEILFKKLIDGEFDPYYNELISDQKTAVARVARVRPDVGLKLREGDDSSEHLYQLIERAERIAQFNLGDELRRQIRVHREWGKARSQLDRFLGAPPDNLGLERAVLALGSPQGLGRKAASYFEHLDDYREIRSLLGEKDYERLVQMGRLEDDVTRLLLRSRSSPDRRDEARSILKRALRYFSDHGPHEARIVVLGGLSRLK